jgi:beta-glucanase (GH16 family)
MVGLIRQPHDHGGGCSGLKLPSSLRNGDRHVVPFRLATLALVLLAAPLAAPPADSGKDGYTLGPQDRLMIRAQTLRKNADDLDLTGYKLTFGDEFNDMSISYTGDGTRWQSARDSEKMADGKSEIGFGISSFLDVTAAYNPFKVENGYLQITAQPDATPHGYPGSWESGLISSEGNFSQKYGYFEMRADLSNSPGAWDAFWLLPDRNPNLDSDSDWTELDIFEHYGNNNAGTYRWIHTNDGEKYSDPNATLQVYSDNPEQVTGYHTYGVNWTPTSLDFYFDGKLMGSRPTPSDYHDPMHILANLAVEKNGSGHNQKMDMKIDYIRVFSNDPNAVAVKQNTVSAPDGKDPGLYGAVTASSPNP